MKKIIILLSICAVTGCTGHKPKPVSVTYTADCYNDHTLVSPPYPYPPEPFVLLPQFPTPPGKKCVWVCHTNYN